MTQPPEWTPPPPQPPSEPPQSPYQPPSEPPQSPYQAPQTPQSPYQAPQAPYQPPQAPQSPYQPPQYQLPQPSDQVAWGASAPGGPGYGPAYPPGAGQWDHLGGQAPTQPPAKRGRGKLIASVVAVVAIAAGGTATYLAVSDKNTNGASSPKAAVQSIVNDLNKSDLVAALDDLPPGERSALSAPFTEEIDQLKRLNVLTSSADPSKLSGITFDLKGLTYSGKPVSVNDHVQLVEINGGTLDVNADAAKVPFTSQFIKTLFPQGLPATSRTTQHIDIAQKVKQSGQPLQLAAEKVGGKWYPSLFYTIAAAAARGTHQTLSAADAIPAVGAASPQDAVTQEIHALIAGDYTSAIKLLSPDELAVMHDYGGLILKSAPPASTPPVTLKDIQFNAKSESGGVTRLTLKSITLTFTENGDTHGVTVALAGNCYDVTVDGSNRHMCASDLISTITGELGQLGGSVTITPAQHAALADLVSGLTNVGGIDTSQSGGKWFINPVRSYLELTSSYLSGLKGNDLLELIGFFQSLDH